MPKGMRLIRMGKASLLVKLDAKTCRIGNFDIAVLINEAFVRNVSSPLNVRIHDFKNFKIRTACRKLKRCRVGNGARRIMRCKGYISALRLGGNLFKTVLGWYYAVTVGDAIYPVTIEIESFYDYSSEVSVSAPSDASEYESVTLGAIVK